MTLKVILNRNFTISLESNPTTGFQWKIAFDGTFMNLEKREFEASSSRSIGAGGKEKFTLSPIKKGETDIIMTYKRPWENKPAEERSFHIIIADS